MDNLESELSSLIHFDCMNLFTCKDFDSFSRAYICDDFLRMHAVIFEPITFAAVLGSKLPHVSY